MSDRDIFTNSHNGRTVKCDPFMLHDRFMNAIAKIDFDVTMSKFAGPDWYGHRYDPEYLQKFGITESMTKLADQRSRESIHELVPVICETFKVKTLEEDQDNGMTIEELLELFGQWQLFVVDVKKNTDVSAESPPPTDAPSQTTLTMSGV